MPKLLKTLRRTARFLLALFLWLHALFIFNVAPSLAPFAARLHSNVSEVTVVFLLATTAVLASYGIANVLVDAAYIYFFPFVFIFLFAKLAFIAISRGYRTIWGDDEPHEYSFQQIIAIAGQPIPQPVPQPIQEPPATPQPDAGTQKRNPVAGLLAPFKQFALLWCLLLFLTSHRLLLWIALVVVLFQLARFLLQVFGLAVLSSSWLGQLEEKIRAHIEGLIQKVLAAKEITQDLRQVWLTLSILDVAVALLRSRRRVVQWTMYLATLLFFGIYMYLAVIFSFAYYGIARLQGIDYQWTSSLVNSVFIPLAFGSLPHSNWIRALGGIHAVSVLLLGAGTVFGYIRKKIDSLHNAAEALSERMQEAELRVKLAEMGQKFQQTPPANPPSER